MAETSPTCSHPDATSAFRVRDYVTGDSFEVLRCGACGQTFTHPRPSSEDLGRYYPQSYYGNLGRRRFPAPVEWLQKLLYKKRVKKIEVLWGQAPGRVLDIGCGKGHLLNAFKVRGWQATGVELTEASAQFGRESFGLTIHAGPTEALALPGSSFDVAILWHVLEHVESPAGLLEEVHRLLVPGGLFLVSVPDFGSPEARIMGPGWFHLDVPRHLHHFRKVELRAALVQSGFQEIESWSFAPEFDLFSFIQSLQNRLGLPPNLLYRLLRNRMARLPGGRAKAWQSAVSILLAVPIGAIGLFWTTVGGLAGKGSTVTLLVRKPVSRA